MKSVTTLLAVLTFAILTATTQSANAVVYCKYVGVPKGCVARPGVALRPAPRAVERAVEPGVVVRPVERPIRRY
jgi:hypothetical protein